MDRSLLELIAHDMQTSPHIPNAPHYLPFYEQLAEQFERVRNDFNLYVKPYNPYESAREMFHDMYYNSRLMIWDGGQNFALLHPMKRKTIYQDSNGRFLTWNEVFRFVYDINGHYSPGAVKVRPYERNDFSQTGEYNAYKAHKAMFTPEAWPALFAETMGTQALYYINGQFPERQKAVLIPVRL